MRRVFLTKAIRIALKTWNRETGRLPDLIRERDHILEQLEIAETRYISAFRLTTPDPSVADLPLPPEENATTRLQISRPKALAGYSVR